MSTAPNIDRAAQAHRILRDCAMADETLRRAQKITARFYPTAYVPHGFFDREGFIASCQYRAKASRFCKEITPRIEAKVRAKFDRQDARMNSAVDAFRSVVGAGLGSKAA